METERGNTRLYCVENWLWKGLWNCSKKECGVNECLIVGTSQSDPGPLWSVKIS